MDPTGIRGMGMWAVEAGLLFFLIVCFAVRLGGGSKKRFLLIVSIIIKFVISGHLSGSRRK